MERRHTDGNSGFLSSEQTDKRVGQDPGKQHAGRHDPCRQFQCHRKYLMYTLQFSGSVIISYQRTDPLNDPIGFFQQRIIGNLNNKILIIFMAVIKVCSL